MSKQFLILDIETGGSDSSKHPLIAIGTALFEVAKDKTFSLVEKKLFVFDFNVQNIEELCMTEFWSKHPEKLKFFQEAEKSTLTDFFVYVDSLSNIELCSDNPTFDFGFVNSIAARRGLGKNFQYSPTGYRLLTDTSSWLRAALMSKNAKYALSNWLSDKDVLQEFNITNLEGIHDHRPDNDAEWIGRVFLSVFVQYL
jgi:hypothetical protein